MNLKVICGVLAIVAAAGGYWLWRPADNSAPQPIEPPTETKAVDPATEDAAGTAERKPVALPKFRATEVRVSPEAGSGLGHGRLPTAVDIQTAISQGLVSARFTGNGRDQMVGYLELSGENSRTRALAVRIPAGQSFESGKNWVVALRAMDEMVTGVEKVKVVIQTVSPQSSNQLQDGEYAVVAKRASRLDPLLAYAAKHAELSTSAAQTAALALTENLPLSAVAKFTPAVPEVRSRFDTDAFRVDTVDIVAALLVLREMGVAEDTIAMTIDPQLKIEAMIEPLSRAAAMQYYGIKPETEWNYWKTELLYGAESTRHYALYGIARFYPDVALEMLPKWARESRTSMVNRMTALQALAETQRPEALDLLKKLATELGVSSELGRAALGSAEYLGQKLKQGAPAGRVGFRASQVSRDSES